MSHNLLSKTDRAVAAYLIQSGVGNNLLIFPAKRSLDKPVPCVVVFSERAKAVAPGVFEVAVSVLVKTIAALDLNDTATLIKDNSEILVSAVFDALSSGWNDFTGAGHELADEITIAGRNSGDADMVNFTVQDVTWGDHEAGFQEKGEVWIDTINLTLLVCPSNVS